MSTFSHTTREECKVLVFLWYYINMLRAHSSNVRGFTLPEMIVVIAVISILAGITLANVSGSREQASDISRVKTIEAYETGFYLAARDYGGFPLCDTANCWNGATTYCLADTDCESGGAPKNSGLVSLLNPYVKLQAPFGANGPLVSAANPHASSVDSSITVSSSLTITYPLKNSGAVCPLGIAKSATPSPLSPSGTLCTIILDAPAVASTESRPTP
ncbi:MAG: hypothetical protein A2675_01885 [Candidatus Yonathbacteria bacterium RIFCSPHIGHO2_01_FULL_51_10]|uniref:Type II secretion system protein GspG C-terminal domain-containing protein n=1 Tax=Candidatus Yonathbacteria bacterium RIFCSPHIGHO2_01_FULL_51_10 TaxID=1802723 RepID=A0A1G2S9X4_9BACT|nr:MAG: hypothetical protein A2675_01885 [Candidatus Yonathbacteria bacterium RIFCSPHIGHO2_01_FULL_51_10]